MMIMTGALECSHTYMTLYHYFLKFSILQWFLHKMDIGLCVRMCREYFRTVLCEFYDILCQNYSKEMGNNRELQAGTCRHGIFSGIVTYREIWIHQDLKN